MAFRPPIWKDIEDDEEFQKLSEPQRLKLFDNWTSDMRGFAAANGLDKDEEVNSNLNSFIAEKRPLFAPQPKQEAAPVAEPEPVDKPFFGIGDTFSALGQAAGDLVTGVPASVYRLTEGLERPDKYSESAKEAFEAERKRAEEMQAEQARRDAEGTSTDVGDAIRQAGRSLGFTAANMAVAIPAGAATGAAATAIAGQLGPQAALPEEVVTVPVGAAVGTIASMVGAGLASGPAAYRMAGNQFLDDAFQEIEKNKGRALTEEEKQKAYETLLPIAQNTALWEAGPEAVGNAVTFGAGKFVFGFGGDVATNIATRALAKTGAGVGKDVAKVAAAEALKAAGKTAAPEVVDAVATTALKEAGKTTFRKSVEKAGAVLGDLSVELGGETITQTQQGYDDAKARQYAMTGSTEGAVDEYEGLAGLGKAFKEVAPATLATMGIMGGAAGAIKAVSTSIPSKSAQEQADAEEKITDLVAGAALMSEKLKTEGAPLTAQAVVEKAANKSQSPDLLDLNPDDQNILDQVDDLEEQDPESQQIGLITPTDDTATAPEVDETADIFANVPKQQPLRDSVVASGIAEEAADDYISNLRNEGFTDNQIRTAAANNRTVMEEAARANEAEAQARAEVARRARTGDADARAQLEAERGIATTPVVEAAPTPVAEETAPAPVAEVVEETAPSPVAATEAVPVEEAAPEPRRITAEEFLAGEPIVEPAPAPVAEVVEETTSAPVAEAETVQPVTPVQAAVIEPEVTTNQEPEQPPVASEEEQAPVADQPQEPAVNVLPTGTDAALPPQRVAQQEIADDTQTAPEVDETADVFANVEQQPKSEQPPVAEQPKATEPGQSAPQPLPQELAAPTPDAQAYEDALVQEAKNAGTKISGTTNKGIKDAIQGKGWYPKTNINKAIKDIKERVQRRLEAEAPQSAQDTAPAPAPAMPEGADELIAESRELNAVPSSATINQRFEGAPVEQRQAVRREAAKQVASDLGIEYSEELDFAKDFDGNDNLPIRVTQTGTEPVFVNNAEVTARQIDAGFTPVVPEAMRGRVVQGITFDANTGQVTSAVGRGVTTTQPGDLARGVRAQRPGTQSQATLTTDKIRKNARPFFRKLNKQDQRDFEGIRVALQNRTPSSREIAAAFAPDDLVEAGLIKWARERVKDRTLAKDKRKNYSASQIWNFVMKDAAEKLKTMPRSVSLDAPLTETGTMTRGDLIVDEKAEKDRADREATVQELGAIEGGVTVDEPTNVSGPIGSASTGMNYDQAYNIINSPVTRGMPKKAVAKLKAEAQELLDMAPQSLIDELENNDIDYWTWTAEDFRNVDTGNTNQIVSSSKRDRSPYIAEQRSWMQQVARSLGMRNVSDFTPPQFTQLARFFADRFRGSFDQGVTALPENALAETLPEIRAMFEAPQGAAATYRDAVEQLRSEFPGATIRYSTNHNAAAWYDPRFRNTLFLNPLLLEQELGGLTAAEAQPFLKAVLFEEYIHSVERQNIPRELVIAIAQRLPENVRQRVIDSYVGGADRFASPEARQEVIDSLTEESIGSEYIRMMVQRMRNGLTTEDLDPLSLPQNLFERVMQVVKALIARLQARLQVARDPVLAHTIRALESGMRKLEIQSELQGLTEQELALISDEPGASKYVFARPRGTGQQTDTTSPNYREEALKVRPGRSYWITPEGRVVDVVAEDQDGTSATHGRYVRNWVKARVGKFFPGEAEKEMARRIQSRAQELMTQDPNLREELDQDELIASYVEEVNIAEAMDLPQPDYDSFVQDAINKLGPSDMAYNEAATEVGWARIAVPPKFSADAPLQIQVKKDALGSGAARTVKEIQGQRVTSVVEDGALANRAVERTDLGRIMQLLRNMPGQAEWQGGIQAARPGIRIRGKRVGGAVPRKPGGFFSSGAFTTTERSIILKASQKIAKAAANAEFLVDQFRKAVKKSYGKNPVPTDLINQALGSTDNRLTDQQVTDLKKIRDKDARELQRLQFMRDNRDAARIARRDALSQLPAPVAKAVEEMGAKIDELSVTMMNEGYIADDLIPVFEENLELYLHRSYAIFESPEWKNNMIRAGEIAETIRGIADPAERQKAIAELPKTTREHVRVRVAFERFATERAIAEYATEIRRQQKQNGVNITRQDAIKMAKADTATIERKASDLVLRYLTVADQDAYRFFVQGRRIPGRRDMDIIKVRGQVPKELREFWGEIKNAETNFTQTVGKLAAFMAHHDVASELLNNGVAEGYIWKAGVSKDPNPNPEFVPLIPKGTASPDSVSPLYGAYGPVELRDALVQMTQPQNTAGWARAFSFMTAMAMAMKTIGYVPRSFIRNFFGNPLIVLGRGLFNLSDPLSMAKAMGDGFRVARLNAGLGGNASYQALRERLLELGVIGDNVRGTLLKKLYEESTEGEKIAELLKRTEYDTALEKMGVKTAQGVYKGASKLADIYQGVDDIWKVYAWEMEKVRQKKAHPTWDVRQIEEAAAENVRNLVPTYSLSPDVTQRIRRIPLFAPFITWTSEILRTTGNNIALAKQEIAEGYRTGNTAMRANGAARLAGFMTATAALPAFAMAMKAAMGYDDDDDEAVRTSLRDWQKNAQIIYLREKDNGKVNFIDLSYLDPNQVFVEPMIAASRAFKKGENPFLAWADEVKKPIFSEQLFVGAMADVMRNRTADGRPIVNEQDTPVNKTLGYMQHVTEAVGPGTLVTTVPNIIRGAQGQVSPSGKVYSLQDEVYSAGFGQRFSEVDSQTTLRQAAGRFTGSNAEATRLLNDTLLSRGTIDVNDIGSAYENANRAKRRLFEQLRDNYRAALKLGVPKAKAVAILREQNVSKDFVGQIVNDRYVDYQPTKQTLNEVVSRPDGRKRITALRDYLLQKREQDRNQNEG